MKLKTTAIAMAVAGTVAAPVAVQAGADELYMSARIGVEMVDSLDVSDFNIRSFSSRFGAKGESDLGNGMTGYGHVEYDIDINSGAEDFDLRHRYVGLKGDFGNVYVGQTYHTFYNTVVGPADPSYWNSGFAMVEYRGRTDSTLTYAGNTGAIGYGISAVAVRDGEEDTPDQIEVGVSFPIGDTTLGIAAITTEADNDAIPPTGTAIGNSSDETVAGVMWSGIGLGDANLAVGFQSQDDDTGFNFALTMGGFYLVGEFESIDEDSQGNPFPGPGADSVDRGGFTLGYEQTLGRKTKMWYEIHSLDNDCPSGVPSTVCDDVTAVQAVLRYDII